MSRDLGLDVHCNGAEQPTVSARDHRTEEVYEGIRLTPARIVNDSLMEDVHVMKLSIRSTSRVKLMR